MWPLAAVDPHSLESPCEPEDLHVGIGRACGSKQSAKSLLRRLGLVGQAN